MQQKKPLFEAPSWEVDLIPEDANPVSPQSEGKATQVRAMFGRIAGRYDLMNRLMTLDRDRIWRRLVVDRARLGPGARLLDIGAGTGGIAQEAWDRDKELSIVAADFCIEMMQVGRSRLPPGSVQWCAADALNLPFGDRTFDAVVSGYLLRNVCDADLAFQEQFRVLRPGGRLVCLDTTPPRGPLAPLIGLYFKRVIPLLGAWIGGDRCAYTYLPESTRAFVDPLVLAHALRNAGFQKITWRTLMFGTMAMHAAVKPRE